MSTPAISALAGLVRGYTSERDAISKENLEKLVNQRDTMLSALGHLASHPGIAPEQQQWLLSKVQELAQADLSKGKLPKVDLAEVPAVNLQKPDRQFQPPSLPPMTIQPPQPPSGASAGVSATQPSAQAQQPLQGPSSEVGRASNGTVNATGAMIGPPDVTQPNRQTNPDTRPTTLRMPQPVAVPQPPALQPPPLNLPAQPMPMVTNPQAPEQLAPQGQLHILTMSDRLKMAQAAEQQQLNDLQRQYPDKSREELAYFAQRGEFPKAQPYTLNPGQARFNEKNQEVARNTEAKPGAKSGYEPVMGPGGPIGVKDVATGGMLSPDEVAKTPQAKSVLDQANKEYTRQLDVQNARDSRKQAFELSKMTQAFQNALVMGDVKETQKAAAEGRKAYNDVNKQYLADQQRFNMMNTLYQDIQRNPTGNKGSFDAALLAFHLGMTTGAVKGMRTGKDLALLHKNARGLGEKMEATFAGWVNGAELSDEQRQNFVELAKEKMQAEEQDVNAAKANYDSTFQEYQSRLSGASGGKVKPKGTPGIRAPQPPSASGFTPPPNAPRAVGPNGHEIVAVGGQWLDAQTGQVVK